MNSGPLDLIERVVKLGVRAALVALVAAVAYRVVTMEIQVSFANVTMEQVTSLVLSIFAIVLALAFYFGANDTSQKFYNQMFNFTKDTSVLLGRIEAGFKERLDRIGSEYGELSGRIERAPAQMLEVLAGIKAQTTQIDEKELIDGKQVREIIERSSLPDADKAAIRRHLDGSAEAVAADRDRLKESIEQLEGFALSAVPDHVSNFLRERIVPGMKRRLRTLDVLGQADDQQLNAAFQESSKDHSRGLLMSLRDAGLATNDRKLTPAGIELIKSIWN